MIPRRMVFVFVVVCVVVWLFWDEVLSMPEWSPNRRPSEHELPSDVYTPEPDHEDITLVVASQIQDNTTWLAYASPTWEKAIFLTDGEVPSRLSVPANKGRESMVYLT